MKTTQIEKTARGYSVTVDGAYKGSFKSAKKAERYAALLTGKAVLDLRASVIMADAATEAYLFDKQ